MAYQIPVPEQYRAMPLVAHFSEWLTENALRLVPFLLKFARVTEHCTAKGRAGEQVTFLELAALISSCVPECELVSSELVLGQWTTKLPFKLQPLPREAWEFFDMLLDGLKISADDLRFLYNNNLGPWRENMDRWVGQARASPIGGDFLRDAKGAEAVVLVADALIGVAEFIGKHPPDHVIEAIAETRGIKIDTLDEKRRFAIKCMLARDPLLKGTPWEQPTLRAKDWRIGVKDAVLLHSIQEQHGKYDVDFRVDGGRIVDIALVPKGTAPLSAPDAVVPLPAAQGAAADGPFAKKWFRWDGKEHPIAANRWKILRSLWGKDGVSDATIGAELWGEDWDESKLSTTVSRLNHDLRKTPWRVIRSGGFATIQQDAKSQL